jgi:hypothetical protein
MALPHTHVSVSRARAPARCHAMARAALGLSIVALVPPLGIAAIVLGHMAANRAESGAGTSNGKVTARAALWIAYLQLALLTATAFFAWSLPHETAQGFQRDPLVQRLFRTSDQLQTLDPDSAREAEGTAQALVYQLMAIEEQARRHRDDGSYVCQLNELIGTGVEGSTDAEKRALAVRIEDSPYMFRISNCNPSPGGILTAAFILTAAPRPPRMPEKSAIYCADQTGGVRQVRGGTSLDCLKSGEAVR